MDPKKLTHKALDHSDDVGALIAAIVGLCGILNVPEKYNISSDELAMALGFGFTIIAFLRGRFERAYRNFLQNSTPTEAKPEDTQEEDSDEPEPPVPPEPPSGKPTLPPPPKISA